MYIEMVDIIFVLSPFDEHANVKGRGGGVCVLDIKFPYIF